MTTKRDSTLFGDGIAIITTAAFTSAALGLWAYDGQPIALAVGVFFGFMTNVATLRWYHDLGAKR